MTRKISFNTFQLKILALIFMTVDHFGFYSTFTTNHDINYIFRIIGRIAAPLFLFLLTEGLHHTKSKKKYIFRLYFASVLTEGMNTLFINTLAPGASASVLGNIFSTFFYVAFYIYFLEQIFIHKNELKKIILSIIMLFVPVLPIFLSVLLGNSTTWQVLHILFPSLITINYSAIFVLIGILWYFIHNKKINCFILLIFSMLSLITPNTALTDFSINIQSFFTNPQWCMFLAIPFILLYNGEKGRSIKYFFYLYYPLHQYYLFFIYLLMQYTSSM